eukprot:CAMPEP_0118650870 /NCGR_PEP_ID=MMETSP0785-20121206/10477_1 /TAXON_ID=91992 /ORGANISM="Bolidomonas pacifica, Strain CCMP 1866" /LENGTH=36 /DNA_ID= /DNA_START= /DNA_END= /DNA_ORIENTATION=
MELREWVWRRSEGWQGGSLEGTGEEEVEWKEESYIM